jgi:hypothetical protein
MTGYETGYESKPVYNALRSRSKVKVISKLVVVVVVVVEVCVVAFASVEDIPHMRPLQTLSYLQMGTRALWGTHNVGLPK